MKDKVFSTPPEIIATVLKVFTALAAGYYIILFLYIAISRITFPIALNWVEGAVLVQTNRILLGERLYSEPSMVYIPLVYQPLYFYIAAAFIKVLGVGMMPIRLLSVLSTCGCILMIFLITKKMSGAYIPALISAGLFAATNGIVWTWFDAGRVDMLCVFLFMTGLYFLLSDNDRGAILAGIFFALSFFSKQTTAPIVLLIFVYYFFANRKKALILMLTFSLLAGTGTLLLNYESNGLYAFYVYTLPSYHQLGLSINGFMTFVVNGAMRPIWVALGVVLFSILLDRKNFARDHRHGLLLVTTIGILILSIWGTMIAWSTTNAFIPAYALIAIMFGLGLQSLQKNIEGFSSGSIRFIGSVFMLGLCLWQFSFLHYKSEDYIPTAQDFKKSHDLINFVKMADGELLIPSENYLALYVNKKVYYHSAALGEFNGWFGKSMPQWEKIKSEILDAIHSDEVNYIYMDQLRNRWLGMTCKKNNIFHSKSKFVPALYKMTCQ